MSAGPIQSVTVGVSDVGASLTLFHGYMGIPIISDQEGTAPGAALTRFAELGFPGVSNGRLQLVERPRATRLRDDLPDGVHSPGRSGAKALDFYVHDDIAGAVRDFDEMGYTRRSEPVRYQVGVVDTEELLLTGPDGLPMMLMYPHDHPATSFDQSKYLGRFSQVATVSVLTSDAAASRSYYADGLGLEVGTDVPVSDALLDPVCRIIGVPRTAVHMQLFYSPLDTHGKYLLIHFPELRMEVPTPLQMSVDSLGINLYTHVVDDPVEMAARLVSFGGREVQAYEGVRGQLVRGPNGELVQLLKRGDAGVF